MQTSCYKRGTTVAVGVAFKAFFAALFDSKTSARIARALASDAVVESTKLPAPEKPKPAAQPKPARSDAITLLATLQREARLVDLVQESLDGYSDAQIGAAARDVIRDCNKTLSRMFAIAPLSDVDEGESIEVSENASPNSIRVSGSKNSGTGTVLHRGWKATMCEVPKWSGHRDDAWIIAPTEVELS